MLSPKRPNPILLCINAPPRINPVSEHYKVLQIARGGQISSVEDSEHASLVLIWFQNQDDVDLITSLRLIKPGLSIILVSDGKAETVAEVRRCGHLPLVWTLEQFVDAVQTAGVKIKPVIRVW